MKDIFNDKEYKLVDYFALNEINNNQTLEIKYFFYYNNK